MYDLWFTLGTAILKPNILTGISNAQPVFKTVKRIIIEDGEIFLDGRLRTSGVLEWEATDRIRGAVASLLSAEGVQPPPVSIYAAGKLSQLLTIPNIGFVGAVQQANQALEAVGGPVNPRTSAFTAFLGLLLIDPLLLSFLRDPMLDANGQAPAAMAEFGLNAAEKAKVKVVANRDEFLSAQSDLLTNPASPDANPWQRSCGEQFIFWNDQNAHAIF